MNKAQRFLALAGMGVAAGAMIGVSPVQAAPAGASSASGGGAATRVSDWGGDAVVGYYRTEWACERAGWTGRRYGAWDAYDCNPVRYGWRGWVFQLVVQEDDWEWNDWDGPWPGGWPYRPDYAGRPYHGHGHGDRDRGDDRGHGDRGRDCDDRGHGAGDRDRGDWDRGRGCDDRGHGAGDRDRGDRDRGDRDRGRDCDDRGHGAGDRDRGHGDWDRDRGCGDQGRGHGDWDRDRDRGDRDRGDRDRGDRDRGDRDRGDDDGPWGGPLGASHDQHGPKGMPGRPRGDHDTRTWPKP
ncbi:hypothetical protein [Actinoplanes teichomyceticus]|uniref:Uncharacterized protein n=1 Tax=Actinoplanes teichomyceticus TaxID=1867 RepID=A0A561VJ86_ACTTI|nr:hypothetical protein [Actinoplanes teichomyceticus]TWG11669.1 hypothetical protein FHX34_106399 [Actinoplanes teichomyceticus]GIF15508.1 hypothetical protein Ate01nite_55400 [Actinoplanes teichomyceticus]